MDLEIFPLHSETIEYKFPHTVQETAANVHKFERNLTDIKCAVAQNIDLEGKKKKWKVQLESQVCMLFPW